MRTSRPRPLLGLAAAALLLPGLASAQTVLLDQQPSQLFSLWGQAGTEALADQVVIGSAGASLGKITWWGGWDNDLVGTDTFDIYVHLDNPGGLFGTEPGAVVASYLGVSPTISSTGMTFPTGVGWIDELMFEYSLPGPLSLAAGTYWIEIYCTGSSGSGSNFNWEMAPEDLVNGDACMAWSLDTPGVTWWVCTPLLETDLALKLEEGSAPGPLLSVSNLVAGGVALLSVDNATPNGPVRHGYSLNGGGPVSTAYGDLLLSPPYTELPTLTADAAGHAALSVPVPVGATGVPVWFHAMDLLSQTFTNGVAEVVG